MGFKVISVSEKFERELKKKHREYMIKTGEKITFLKFTDLVSTPHIPLRIKKTVFEPEFDLKEIKI